MTDEAGIGTWERLWAIVERKDREARERNAVITDLLGKVTDLQVQLSIEQARLAAAKGDLPLSVVEAIGRLQDVLET